MLALPEERDVLKRLHEWGEAESGIRAMILTSSHNNSASASESPPISRAAISAAST